MLQCDVLPPSSTQEMQAAGSFETKVTVHQSALCHIKVECSFKGDCRKTPKFSTGAMSVNLNLEAFNLPKLFF